MDEFASRQYPVQEDMAFQRRMWIVQRIGWALLGVISLAALCGLFGNGVLSKRTATGAEMSIEYERFERAKATCGRGLGARPQSFAVTLYYSAARLAAMI